MLEQGRIYGQMILWGVIFVVGMGLGSFLNIHGFIGDIVIKTKYSEVDTRQVINNPGFYHNKYSVEDLYKAASRMGYPQTKQFLRGQVMIVDRSTGEFYFHSEDIGGRYAIGAIIKGAGLIYASIWGLFCFIAFFVGAVFTVNQRQARGENPFSEWDN